MTRNPMTATAPAGQDRRFWTREGTIVGACRGLVILITGAYFNGLTTPLVFDDASIFGDASAAQDWRVARLCGRPWASAGAGADSAGRRCRRASGTAVPSGQRGTARDGGAGADGPGPPHAPAAGFPQPLPAKRWAIAAVIAAIWALHPLQTSAVTHVAGRIESTAGLFYSLVLYFRAAFRRRDEQAMKRAAIVASPGDGRRPEHGHSADSAAAV